MVGRKTSCALSIQFENKFGWEKKVACILWTDADCEVGLQPVDVLLDDIYASVR